MPLSIGSVGETHHSSAQIQLTIAQKLAPISVPQFPDRTAQIQEAQSYDTAKAHCQAAGGVFNNGDCQYPLPPPPAVTEPLNTTTSDFKLMVYIRESGNRPNAVNRSSGACGLGQALPCSKMGCSLDDYGCQDNYFTGYMLGRYGSWAAAWQHELGFGWW